MLIEDKAMRQASIQASMSICLPIKHAMQICLAFLVTPPSELTSSVEKMRALRACHTEQAIHRSPD